MWEDGDKRDCEGRDGMGVSEDEVSAMDWDDGDGAKVLDQEEGGGKMVLEDGIVWVREVDGSCEVGGACEGGGGTGTCKGEGGTGACEGGGGNMLCRNRDGEGACKDVDDTQACENAGGGGAGACENAGGGSIDICNGCVSRSCEDRDGAACGAPCSADDDARCCGGDGTSCRGRTGWAGNGGDGRSCDASADDDGDCAAGELGGFGGRSRETSTPVEGGRDCGAVLDGGRAGGGGPSELSRDNGTRRSYIGSIVSLDAACSFGTTVPSPPPPTTAPLLCPISPQRYATVPRLASTLEDVTSPAFGVPYTDGNVEGGEAGRCSYRGLAPPSSGCGAIKGPWTTLLLTSSAPVFTALDGL